jgi:hypothetical protein
MTRRYVWTALALLIVGTVLRFGWRVAPEGAQADAWNVSQALLVLVLLALVAHAYRCAWVLRVAALLGAWQGMTVACSLAYLHRPWAVLPGQEQCDAMADAPLSMLGFWLAGLLLATTVHGAQHDASAK